MTANKLCGIIYMSPLQINLKIIDLDDNTVLEEASSALLVHNNQQNLVYEHELAKITTSLKGFLALLKAYGVDDYHFYANQQLIPAHIAHYLSDQIYVRTKLKTTWLNTSQLNYYKTIAVMSNPGFKKLPNKTTYLMNIGAATVTLSKFKKNDFQTAWNISLGYQELDEITSDLRNMAANPNEVVKDYINSKFEYLRPEFNQNKDEVNILLQDPFLFNNLLQNKGSDTFENLDTAGFNAFSADYLNAPDQFISQHLNIDTRLVKRVVPDILMIQKLLKFSKAKHLTVTTADVIEGLSTFHSYLAKNETQKLNSVILTSAENMANRYVTDANHRHTTVTFALHLFDQLKKLHRLDDRCRLLLQIAANVDDIGAFINAHGHYRHSAYILKANPLIGLSDEENSIIAAISRYHSSETPEDFIQESQLPYTYQLIVAKLSAMLRLADALDDSRKQKIQKISVSLKSNYLLITALSSHNLALEKWAFQQKAALFEEVFGIKVILKQRKADK